MDYRKRPQTVQAIRLSERMEIATDKTAWVGNPGDYLVLEGGRFTGVMTAAQFLAEYEPTPPANPYPSSWPVRPSPWSGAIGYTNVRSASGSVDPGGMTYTKKAA